MVGKKLLKEILRHILSNHLFRNQNLCAFFFLNSSRVSLLIVVNSETLSKSERNLCIKKIFCFQLFLMLSKIIFDSLFLHMDARLFFLRGPNMCS